MLAKQLPKVSREFALDLQRRFPPIEVNPSMDRDTMCNLMMQSYGEQRVLNLILHASNNKVVSSNKDDIKPNTSENTDNTTPIEVVEDKESKRKGSIFRKFTTRINH